jgi:hypothetical protein
MARILGRDASNGATLVESREVTQDREIGPRLHARDAAAMSMSLSGINPTSHPFSSCLRGVMDQSNGPTLNTMLTIASTPIASSKSATISVNQTG